MSKVLKRLYLGDVVAKGTTRQLRKLTTEIPQEESIIGTWRFKDTLTNPFETPTNGYVNNQFAFDIPDITLVPDGNEGTKEWESVQYGYWSGDTTITLSYKFTGGAIIVYENGEWKAPNGYTVDDVKTIVIESQPLSKTFITWLKANAVKQESIVGTWVLNEELTLGSDVVGVYDIQGETTYWRYVPDGYNLVKPFVNIEVAYTQSSSAYYLCIYSKYPNYNYAYSSLNTYNWLNGNEWRSSYINAVEGEEGSLVGIDATDVVYRTITITGGADIENETFITWLKANATKIA